MFQKKKLSIAVASTLAASMASGLVHAQMLEEVLVTATKRSESMQDIPVAIQAMTGDTMSELGVATFDEYVQFLPNVTMQGRGPGRSEIYIRGAATEQSKNSVSSVQGSAPQVALYVDEQPVAFGGRNLDVYAADLARVEVLPGPQGTLFGASSQSGTVRLITNKPVQGEFEMGFDASFGNTSGGEISTSGEAYINVPLTDKLAVRAVVYNDNQGGWIDNVPARLNPDSTEIINVMNRNQISGAAAILPTATVAGASNEGVVEDDWNDATYSGYRVGVAYDINDDWNVLLQHTSQTLNSEGVWEYAPVLGGESSSQVYAPDQNQDKFGLTTWTLEGRVGFLDVIYTGGFLDREVDQILDYTTYSFGGGYQVYYISTGGYSSGDTVYDFYKQYKDKTNNERTTHELRFQTPGENRFRVTAGVFIDDIETVSEGEFQYAGAVEAGFNVAVTPGDAADLGPIDGVSNPNGRGQSTIFINNFTREEEQTAFFVDASFDINDALTLSVGARDYDIDFALRGSTGSSFGCKGVDPAGLPAAGTAGQRTTVAVTRPDGTIGCDGNAFDNNVTQRLRDLGAAGNTPGLGADGVANQSDTIFRATIDWKVSDDKLLFATWSEGFRPQVTNRNAGVPSGNQSGVFAGYSVPAIAQTDELTNYEVGFKGDFLDGSLRLNATLYRSEIDNLQTSRFDPSNIAFLVFIENVGDAEVTGIDLDFQWGITENFTLMGALGWVDSEITRLNPQLEGLAAPVGSELPYQADISFNLRARYDWNLSSFDADAFVQGAVVYTGDSKAGVIGNAYFVEDTARRIYGVGTGLEIENEGGTFGATRVATEVPGSTGLTTGANGDTFFQNGRFVQKSYSLFNLSAGINKDSWRAEVFVDNVFDENAQVHISTLDYIPTVSTNRPRTFGLRFSYDYE